MRCVKGGVWYQVVCSTGCTLEGKTIADIMLCGCQLWFEYFEYFASPSCLLVSCAHVFGISCLINLDNAVLRRLVCGKE